MGMVMEKIREMLFGDIVEDDIDYYQEEEVSDTNVTDYDLDITDIKTVRNQNKTNTAGKVVNMTGDISTYILRVAPNSFDEVRDYVDCLKDRKILVVNLDNVDYPLAQRIMDFLGGAAYSLEGAIEECGKNVYIIAHKNADVSSSIIKRGEYASKKGLSWISNR